MSNNRKLYENGSWRTVVTESTDPAYSPGDTIHTGTYVRTDTGSADIKYDINTLGFKSATSSSNLNFQFSGDMSFTFQITGSYTESTDHPMRDWKPTWDTEPMEVGNSWTDDTTYTYTYDESFTASGDVSGSGSGSGTYHYYYNLNLECTAVSAKTVKGKNYAEAFKVTEGGSFNWDWSDGTNTDSGTVNLGGSEKWIAEEAGWAIEYNQTNQLEYTSYEYFQNSAPELTGEPPDEVDINEDEIWSFIHGDDYTVTDPDSTDPAHKDTAGKLQFSIESDPDIGLDIDQDTGDIEFTPEQADVQDGIDVTITVTDMDDENPLSIDVEFVLNILNKNDKPVADPAVMVDFEMDEGDEITPSWNLGQVFSDEDLENNPNTGGQYDPLDELTYSVQNNGSVWIHCNDKPLDTNNQCDNIEFVAADGNFPRETLVTLTFTATDAYNEKASDQILVTVKHVNHAPTPNADAEDEYEMDEDTDATLNLKDYFDDIDVGNPQYPTNDQLTYDKDGEEEITVQITGSKAKLSPAEDWNGEEEIIFSATDKSGGSAEFDLKVIVLPVNDAPKKDTVTPETDPQLDEVDEGDANSQTFTASATDVDGDVLKFNWSVEHSESGDKWDVSTLDTAGSYTLNVDYDCDYSDEVFCGDDASVTYIVTVTVTDGIVDVELKKWFVVVNNVNRDPTIGGIEISQVDKSGTLTPQTPSSADNYTFKYKKVYRLDVTTFVSDLDEGLESGLPETALDNLSFEWTSDKQGPLGSDASIDLASGKSSSLASNTLKKGTHVITLRVTDPDTGAAEYTFTVKVKGDDTGGPGFELVFGLAAVLVAVVIVRRKFK
jgi:PGF-CTERM protein